MMKPVYISSASVISPQQTFEEDGFLQQLTETQDGTLFVRQPDYRKYINPVAIRRMSKLLKMGISTGMNALEKAGVTKPDAIITGTGRGSMVDTEAFLLSMIEMEEGALTPTSFIQSTYNSVNGWLALQTKSNGYNQTYVNRGTSFELSMFDAQMLLNETNDIQNVLVGCFDEITADYVRVKDKIGYWKHPSPGNLALLDYSHTPGTIAGEGAAFFTVSRNRQKALCSLRGIEMLQDAAPAELSNRLNKMLENHGLSLADIDVLLCGMNGDVNQQLIYTQLIENLAPRTSVAAFKHLCGEYDTSSGFATWVAANLFTSQELPGILMVKQGDHEGIKNILVVNHYILNSTSLILLQGV